MIAEVVLGAGTELVAAGLLLIGLIAWGLLLADDGPLVTLSVELRGAQERALA